MQDAVPDTPGIALCNSADLVDSGLAVPFDVIYCGQT
ncbi:MAG: Rieske (2Fe-2S) protein, partial [Curvibacter sp.]